VKLIALTQGRFAKVDDADFDWLNQWKWSAIQKGTHNLPVWYARRGSGSRQGPRIYMHRMLCPSTAKVAHKDDDGLNNQRGNLVAATHAQNMAAIRKTGQKTASFRGVCQQKGRNKWIAAISHNSRRIYLGSFTSQIEAAHAYDFAARRLKGNWARLNS